MPEGEEKELLLLVSLLLLLVVVVVKSQLKNNQKSSAEEDLWADRLLVLNIKNWIKLWSLAEYSLQYFFQVLEL